VMHLHAVSLPRNEHCVKFDLTVYANGGTIGLVK